jgi:hypothetical protein
MVHPHVTKAVKKVKKPKKVEHWELTTESIHFGYDTADLADLLDEGWEPYAVAVHGDWFHHFLRRKV